MRYDEIIEAMNESVSKLEGSRRVAERDALLDEVVLSLKSDSSVVAAWLFGSLGRGTEDALSDLDIFVVVKDEAIDDFILDRRTKVATTLNPFFFVEAPQNRPPEGAYLMALYSGETGPHIVDWYWQRESQACIPSQTRLLFERTCLPRSIYPTTCMVQPAEPTNELRELNNSFRFCWAMTLIAGKYSARHPKEKGNGMIANAWRIQQELRFKLTGEATSEAPAQPNSEENLKLLFQLADSLETLIPAIRSKGGTSPTGIREQTQLFLDFISPCFELEGER